MKFWKKVGAGAAIGLAFGILAAFGFASITRVVDHFFPGKAQVSAEAEVKNETVENSGEKAGKGSEKVETAKLTKADDDGIVSKGVFLCLKRYNHKAFL